MDYVMTTYSESSMQEDDRGFFLYHRGTYVGFIPKDPVAYAELFDPVLNGCRSAIAGLRRARQEPLVKLVV